MIIIVQNALLDIIGIVQTLNAIHAKLIYAMNVKIMFAQNANPNIILMDQPANNVLINVQYAQKWHAILAFLNTD